MGWSDAWQLLYMDGEADIFSPVGIGSLNSVWKERLQNIRLSKSEYQYV